MSNREIYNIIVMRVTKWKNQNHSNIKLEIPFKMSLKPHNILKGNIKNTPEVIKIHFN